MHTVSGTGKKKVCYDCGYESARMVTSVSKAFLVDSKDLFDREKNPNLSLSVADVEKNDKIPKKRI